MALLNSPNNQSKKKSAADVDAQLGLEPVHSSEDTVESLMWRIVRYSAVALVALAVIGAIVGWFMAGAHGIVAAVIALVILLIFSLMTPAVFGALAHGKMTFSMLTACLVVSWMIKIVIIIIALVALKSATWFDHRLFAIYVVVGAIVVIGIEAYVVLTSRFPYVSNAGEDKK
ncbi:MAG: hypothetical protein LKJ47_00990 [Bifidobacteriaceae bacterium]|jgi:fumarate reductase subunit D|nr:hypothetical protein [Bifidobacteriaceae bacterium]